MSDRAQVFVMLRRVVGGDTSGLSSLAALDHEQLRDAAGEGGVPLVVCKSATVSILRRLIEGSLSPEQAQDWASFMRRGYFANRNVGPIQPVDIKYEEAWEEDIAATVSRLDEIGDAIDGDVALGELRELLLLLGEV